MKKKSSDQIKHRFDLTLPELKLLRALTRRTQLAKKVEEAIEKAERK